MGSWCGRTLALSPFVIYPKIYAVPRPLNRSCLVRQIFYKQYYTHQIEADYWRSEGCYWLAILGASLTFLNQFNQLLGEPVKEFFFGRGGMDNVISITFFLCTFGSIPFYVLGEPASKTDSGVNSGSGYTNDCIAFAALSGAL